MYMTGVHDVSTHVWWRWWKSSSGRNAFGHAHAREAGELHENLAIVGAVPVRCWLCIAFPFGVSGLW